MKKDSIQVDSSQLGIADQATEFDKAVPVNERDIRVLSSLNQARNCFAHRQGRVGERDVDAETGLFYVRWTAFRWKSQNLTEPSFRKRPSSDASSRMEG